MATLMLAIGVGASRPADARPHHHRRALRHVGYHRVRDGYAVYRSRLPPIAGTVGTPIPPYAAHFMGYPYNVSGYSYEYADGCLFRVGGPFGPGPSIAPCPFGADRPDRVP